MPHATIDIRSQDGKTALMVARGEAVRSALNEAGSPIIHEVSAEKALQTRGRANSLYLFPIFFPGLQKH